MNDQSVLYSDQVITFTTVIEQDEATGQLVCTDMYYGWWDAAANQNVRFDEQYADYETQPGNIGDMSKLNPDWHRPSTTRRVRWICRCARPAYPIAMRAWWAPLTRCTW